MHHLRKAQYQLLTTVPQQLLPSRLLAGTVEVGFLFNEPNWGGKSFHQNNVSIAWRGASAHLIDTIIFVWITLAGHHDHWVSFETPKTPVLCFWLLSFRLLLSKLHIYFDSFVTKFHSQDALISSDYDNNYGWSFSLKENHFHDATSYHLSKRSAHGTNYFTLFVTYPQWPISNGTYFVSESSISNTRL
jgi:hypothetical protein